MDLDTLSIALEARLRDLPDHGDASHDIHHARRVKANALAIADREETADRTVLVAAAYLHDLVNLPKTALDRARASTYSAEAAAPILRALGLDEERVARTQHAIAAHSFSAAIEPATLEAGIIQDADRLEALGAIGIARVFYLAASLGSALFDGDDPFAAHRPLDDRRFAVDHFAVKLLRLPDTMRTHGGRAVAGERAVTMRAFLAALGTELGAPCPWSDER